MNKKKEYQKPTMHTVELRHTQILAGSDDGMQEGANSLPNFGASTIDE